MHYQVLQYSWVQSWRYLNDEVGLENEMDQRKWEHLKKYPITCLNTNLGMAITMGIEKACAMAIAMAMQWWMEF